MGILRFAFTALVRGRGITREAMRGDWIRWRDSTHEWAGDGADRRYVPVPDGPVVIRDGTVMGLWIPTAEDMTARDWFIVMADTGRPDIHEPFPLAV